MTSGVCALRRLAANLARLRYLGTLPTLPLACPAEPCRMYRLNLESSSCIRKTPK